ncbi:hypothetical protein D9758_013684 [Tetrapyrgos nigripes]|uniref:Uncharacterized protein n=1 Tax=Tetrapyrgos nigripes TaxID=182062 RepID=A0A8H5CLQ2_9AGAR|nr:hypothetical protein D9758_013684 [Tetrapyrgos nigripes]
MITPNLEKISSMHSAHRDISYGSDSTSGSGSDPAKDDLKERMRAKAASLLPLCCLYTYRYQDYT